jgi:hypothetical protein
VTSSRKNRPPGQDGQYRISTNVAVVERHCEGPSARGGRSHRCGGRAGAAIGSSRRLPLIEADRGKRGTATWAPNGEPAAPGRGPIRSDHSYVFPVGDIGAFDVICAPFLVAHRVVFVLSAAVAIDRIGGQEHSAVSLRHAKQGGGDFSFTPRGG